MRPIVLPLLCFYVALSACSSGDFEKGDHDFVLKIAQLQEYGVELPENHAVFESFSRTRWFDGSVVIEYEFNAPEELGLPYLSSIAEWHRSSSDACKSYAAGNIGLPLGLGDGELSIRNDLFQFGTQSRFGLLVNDGHPYGNYFAMCSGKTSYIVILGGLYFDDGELWGELIQPALDSVVAREQ